jgi:hypothetical protein
MRKISNPQQLRSEIREIMSTVAEGCSRERIASDLRSLAEGLTPTNRAGITAAGVVAPIVNLNGSDADVLSKALEVAYRALRKAADALSECAPHGRDYQMNPPQDYPLARAQHDARQESVRQIMKDLMAINEQIDRQKVDRARQSR